MIKMFKVGKETIVEAVRRALKNAAVNNRKVELHYESATIVIDQEDELPALLKEIKKQLLIAEIAAIKQRMAII